MKPASEIHINKPTRSLLSYLANRAGVFIPDPEREWALFDIMFRSVLHGARNGLNGGLIMAACMAWMFWPQRHHTAYGIWFLILISSVIFRHTLFHVWNSTYSCYSQRHALTVSAIYLLIGALWGSAGWVFNLHAVGWNPFALLTCQYLLLVMSVIALSGYFLVFLAFSASLCLLLPVPWIVQDGQQGWVVAFGTLATFVICFNIAAQSARTQAGSIRLRFENQDLIRQLTAEKTISEQAQHVAEDANQAKSRLLAAASHDLRQPLQSLNLLIEVLQYEQNTPRVAEISEYLAAASQSLDELLTELLDISRLEAGVFEPKVTVVVMQDIFSALGRELLPQAQKKGLDLRIVPTRAKVHSDPMMLTRILRNMLSNAICHTQSGGIVLGCRVRSRYWLLEVYDTGPGIPETHQEIIFQEFYQLSNPERDRRKGLGLGLSIVRGLCHLLDHPLGLRSQMGHGSCFWVRIPAAVESPPVVEQMALDLDKCFQGRRVLVIDDDPGVCYATAKALEAWGCQCMAVEDDEQALQLLREHAKFPEFLIVDYRLRNGRTGVEAISRIRSTLGSDIPAMIVTGDTAPERLKEAHASGFTLLHKPVRGPALKAMLAALWTKEGG